MERKSRILIVEDNEINMMIFRDILTSAGYEVLEAWNGQEALAAARKEIPDLILMDIQLPGIDGLELIRILQADPSTKAVPIVALTAHAMAGHREKAMRAGCSGYITKPIRSREFRQQIQGYLAGRRDD